MNEEIAVAAASGKRAVQYLRMSTEHQRYSLENQASAIGEYAQERGYEIVGSYVDAGKSGLSLKGREGLKSLLSDALAPGRPFDAILVLDVSRWGRFQDPDQAAHYEFVCRQAGLAVAYCAEPFENDGTVITTIIKHLKRVMAGEYSRELSVKLSRAHLHGARLGFRQGGGLACGFRRQLLDDKGKPRLVLERGQSKALSTDRVIVVHGPEDELTVIRRIFRMYVGQELSMSSIAERLRAEGIPGNHGLPWSGKTVRSVLGNELCIGRFTYNRTTKKLQGRTVRNDEREWVRVEALTAVVPPRLFARAQQLRRSGRAGRLRDAKMLTGLRRLLRRKGYLSRSLIDKAAGLPSASTFAAHFGGIREAYRRVGYSAAQGTFPPGVARRWTPEAILEGLRRLHDRQGFLSAKTIGQDAGLPNALAISRHFGSLVKAYAAAGFAVTHSELILSAHERRRQREHLSPRPRKPKPSGSGATSRFSDQDLLDGLRRLFQDQGYLSASLINDDPTMPSAAVVCRRFGSLFAAYAKVGGPASIRQAMIEMHRRRLTSLSATGFQEP